MSIEEILIIIWWATVGVITLIVVLLLYLMFRKYQRNRRLQAIAKVTEQLAKADSPLNQYISTGERSRKMLAKSKIEQKAIEEMLIHRLSLSRAKSEQERIMELSEYYFADMYAAELRSSRWSHRINALLYIEQFQMTRLKSDLLVALKRKNCTGDERFLILRILATFQASEIMDELEPAAIQYSEIQLLQLVLLIRGELLDRLLLQFDKYSPKLRYTIIDSLRINNIRTQDVLQLLEQLIYVNDKEMRIRAMKALANFGYMSPEAADRMEQELAEQQSVSWQERLMRVKVINSTRDERFLPYLEQMVSDDAYEVRLQSAQALLRYRQGAAILEQIATDHPDRFAREMAQEILERRNYERNVG
ncbi:HEAT repeat domain-containing protein [Paenibacillus sp. PK4536]|uniref:HEAT repeat domain-containing protein n=1 Tax=Paenibacillus sp. PK4536 TaxID=3024576 RepID=UPI002358F187|nr:HEAT repeat domain-containing protein [Paenibacillus sp. PK4536]WIM39897.1 HEAT repeat domain-containing protein [Paenibacillus sp. PK4536]